MFHSNFHSKSRGTAILIHKDVPFSVSSSILDPNGRYVMVFGTLYNTALALVNIYAPNWDDVNFFNNLFRSIPNLDTHHLILGGDFSLV